MSIEGRKIVIKELFGDEYFYGIPEYQRPYSWSYDQWDELFNDLYYSDREKEYFLGTLILQKTVDVGTSFKYDVIDGQQRITTLQILFAVLRDSIEDSTYKKTFHNYISKEANELEGIPEKIKLEVRERQVFKEIIQEMGGTGKTTNFVPENSVQKKIISCVDYYRNRVALIEQDLLKKFAQHIVQKGIMLYLKTEEFDDAYRMFTIINDRGMELRRIDILKSINLDPNVITVQSDREYYSKMWERIEGDLGSAEFENLMFLIRSIVVKDRAREDILKEFEKYVFSKNIISKGKQFIGFINEYKTIYQSLFDDRDIFEVDNEVTNEFWNYISLVQNHFPSNEWMACLMLYYKKFKTDRILEFFKVLERKISSDWIISETPAKRSVDIHNIIKEIENNDKPENIISSVIFKVDNTALEQEFRKSIYGKRHAKYTLLKLELLSSDHSIRRDFNGIISVEHILPQNPLSGSVWERDFTSAEMSNWTHKIANLVLLSKKKNSSASNRDFIEKKTTYLKPKITDFSRSLEVLNESQWTPKVLERRQEQIISELLM